MASDPIDVTLDLLADAGGKDPDSHSIVLREYHQRLWSRALPDGTPFELDKRLHHDSARAEWWLASDAMTNSYREWGKPARFVRLRAETPNEEVQALFDAGCTVGAYIVFPYANPVNGKYPWSMNQSRGMRRQIRDRMDLTLECIRRHYLGEESPLTPTLDNVRDFFDLFADFEGYVHHFLLDPLVTPTGAISYFTDDVDLEGDGLPRSVEEYRTYIQRSISFIRARNDLISRREPGA